jgi:predicted small lipoprotein YifL
MKVFLISLCAIAMLFALQGCESELPPDNSNASLNAAKVPERFERGLEGQGTLYQPDRSSDPVIREESRVGN